MALGTDHCEIGCLLAREWKLPLDIFEGIRNHHRTQPLFSPDNPAILIQLSEYLASKMDYTAMNGPQSVLDPSLRKHMMDNITEYKVILTDLPDEIAKARSIYQMDGETP
jgi:hypothetical protein